MQLRVTSDLDKIGISEGIWNHLVSLNETNTIFQTYQWFSSWWKVFGKENRLFFMSLYENGELYGFVPLMISSNGHNNNKRILRFVGDEKADYCDFVIPHRKEEALFKIIEAIFSLKNQWDEILFNNIPEYSMTMDIILKQLEIFKYKAIVDSTICPTLLIKSYEGEANSISSKASLRRRYNYFNKKGNLSFFHMKTAEEIKKYLPIFFDQHIERRSITMEPSLFLESKNREFYLNLILSLLDKGWVLFSVVEFNGHPIAFHYGFDYNSKVTWYKPSFDLKYEKHSPGMVLIKFLLDYSISNKRDEFDFTIGDELFKRRFTNEQRLNYHINIYKSPAQYFIELTKRQARRVFKKTFAKNRK